jgi:hypothetical protein
MCPLADLAGRPLWRVETVHDGDTVTCLDERGQPENSPANGTSASVARLMSGS